MCLDKYICRIYSASHVASSVRRRSHRIGQKPPQPLSGAPAAPCSRLWPSPRFGRRPRPKAWSSPSAAELPPQGARAVRTARMRGRTPERELHRAHPAGDRAVVRHQPGRARRVRRARRRRPHRIGSAHPTWSPSPHAPLPRSRPSTPARAEQRRISTLTLDSENPLRVS